jgi:hypothetical protein
MRPFSENLRKLKRYENKMFGSDREVYRAWNLGQYDAERGNPKRNPFPNGRRHREYERGYDLADPMGDHHGRNV